MARKLIASENTNFKNKKKPVKDRKLSFWYNRIGFSSLRWIVFETDIKNDIWEANLSSLEFSRQYMCKKWVDSLNEDEQFEVVRIIDGFLFRYSDVTLILRHLATLKAEEVAKKLVGTGMFFGFSESINEDLGLRFEDGIRVSNRIISNEKFFKVVSSARPHLQYLAHRFEFREALACNLLRVYIKCIIDAIRKLFNARLVDGSIQMWNKKCSKEEPGSISNTSATSNVLKKFEPLMNSKLLMENTQELPTKRCRKRKPEISMHRESLAIVKKSCEMGECQLLTEPELLSVDTPELSTKPSRTAPPESFVNPKVLSVDVPEITNSSCEEDRNNNKKPTFYEQYSKNELSRFRYEIFCKDEKLENIWEEQWTSLSFAQRFMRSDWLNSLTKKENSYVMEIINAFLVKLLKNLTHFDHYKKLEVDKVAEVLSEIKVYFTFKGNLIEMLGINLKTRFDSTKQVVSFEKFRDFMKVNPLRNTIWIWEIKQKSSCHSCRNCCIFKSDASLMEFGGNESANCEENQNKIAQQRTKFQSSPGVNSQNVTSKDSQTAKWIEEFVGFSDRIKIKEFTRYRRNIWFTEVLVSEPDVRSLFTTSFAYHSSYHLPKSALQYLREIDRNSRKNFKSLVKNGEFKRLSRQILNGYVGNNDIQQRGELHDVLGELMVVIGKRILQFGNLQLLTGQLESFVRKLSYSRDFVFCEDNVDLVENFDPEIEDCLARLLEGCHGFSVEKSMVHMKCAIIRYVIRVAVHILRNVVRVKLAEGEIRSFIYDDTFEFEPLSSPNAPQSASITIHRETGRSSMECVYIGNPVGMTPRIAKQIKRKSLDKGQNCKVASKKSRLYDDEIIEIAAPGVNSQSVTLEVSQTAKWVEEFIGFSNRIKIKEFVQSHRNWFTRALVKKPDECNLFVTSFPNYNSYYLPKRALEYLRKIDRSSRGNLKSLVKNGEFKRLSQKLLNGYVGNNDIQQRGELHDVLGELMVVIGKRILQFGNLQLLTGQLELFVRKISYLRDFVFCEDNADLVENFDPEIEDCLARLLEGCNGFSIEKSMVHMKCAIIRYVIRVAVHILRNVVIVKLENREIKSFIYDKTLEFEPSSTPNTPKSASITIHRQTGRSMECVDIGNPVRSKARVLENSEKSTSHHNSNSSEMLKKAEDDDRISEEMLGFMRGIVSENERLKKELNNNII